MIYTTGNTQGKAAIKWEQSIACSNSAEREQVRPKVKLRRGGRQPPLRIDNHETSALPYYIYGWTDVLTAVNRANVNVSPDRHRWYDTILKSSTTDLGTRTRKKT